MGAALTDNDPLDRCSTDRTGLPGSLVHVKGILEISSAVDPVNAGAIAADAFFSASVGWC